jgi:hypothetical protein
MTLRTPPKLAFVPPALPTLVARSPNGDDWLHEVKHDGYRARDFGQFLARSAWACEFVEQRLGLSQIRHGEPLSEPAINRCEEGMCLGALTLVTPEPGEAGGGAQLEKPRTLAAGGANGLVELGCNCLTGCAFRSQQIGLYAIQLCRVVSFAIGLAMGVPGFNLVARPLQFPHV